MTVEEYFLANDAVNSVFLSGRFKDRALYITCDIELRQELASHLGVPQLLVEQAVCRAVTSKLAKSGDPFARLEVERRSWLRNGSTGRPPFTALLFASSYAAGLMADQGDFGANNYYDRLASVLDFPPGNLRQYGRSIEPFWKSFNAWLSGLDDELGRPTAKPFNANKYVNYSQSQVIVRSGDRPLFRDMFERKRLEPTDRITLEDMQDCLNDWFEDGGGNERLQRVWRAVDLRERVSEIALEELQASPPSKLPDGSRSSADRLSLILRMLPRLGRTSILLDLGVAKEIDAPISVRNADGYVGELSSHAFAGFAILTPSILAPPFSALDGPQSLTMRDGVEAYSYDPGDIIPFERSLDGPYWIESRRARMRVPLMIMVRDEEALRTKVNRFLSQVCEGNIRVVTRETRGVAGLPPGWVIYADVQIVRLASALTELKRIMPLSSDAGIQKIGGMRLDGRRWLRVAAPEVQFESKHQDISLRVVAMARGGESQSTVIEKSGEGKLSIDSSSLSALGDGEYLLQVVGLGGKIQHEETVYLRSSDGPRKLLSQDGERLGYKSLISASICVDEASSFYVQGVIQPNATALPESSTTLGASNSEGIPASVGEEIPICDAEEKPPVPVRPVLRKPVQCVARGTGKPSHIWDTTESHNQLGERLVKSRCRLCGRGVLVNLGLDGVQVVQTNAVISQWEAAAPRTSSGIDHDSIFDAMSYLGAGPVSRIERFVSDGELERFVISNLLSGYMGLGLIDVSYSAHSCRPEAWSVAPPAVCIPHTGEAFLTGFRCPSLIRDVRRAIESAGGQLVVTRRVEAPALIQLVGIDRDKLAVALAGLRDPLGRKLEVVFDASARISSVFSQLSGLADCLREASFDRQGADRFDPSVASWLPRPVGESSGAFRTTRYGADYFFVDRQNKSYMGPHQLVKLMAARSVGSYLHGYDAGESSFFSVMGAEPLGLLARALICSTGRLPLVEFKPGTRQARLKYKNVSLPVAKAVLDVLYHREILR